MQATPKYSWGRLFLIVFMKTKILYSEMITINSKRKVLASQGITIDIGTHALKINSKVDGME